MEPRDLVERGQNGVAAALRLFNNYNLIPNGPAPEHFIGALTFSGDTNTNARPLASDEFTILTQILGELASVDVERGPSFLGLLNYVVLECPTLPEVTSEIKDEVSSTCRALQVRFGVLDLDAHTSKVTESFKLSTPKFSAEESKNHSKKPNSIQVDKKQLIESFIKNQAPNDELVTLIGDLSNLTRDEYVLASQRLLALAVTREEAAKALVALSIATHDDLVTCELRTDSMSKLYRSTSRDEIRTLAMQGSQEISSLGFKSKYDLDSEQEEGS